MKQVRERSNAQAWVVLNKEGVVVATVQSLHTYSAVQVDIFDRTQIVWQRKAGGYGYDKLTSAMAGATIDGHKIYDHCGTDEHTDKILEDYRSGKISEKTAQLRAKKIGASFANWRTEDEKYMSLHYRGGLKRLEGLGYRVIQAL